FLPALLAKQADPALFDALAVSGDKTRVQQAAGDTKFGCSGGQVEIALLCFCHGVFDPQHLLTATGPIQSLGHCSLWLIKQARFHFVASTAWNRPLANRLLAWGSGNQRIGIGARRCSQQLLS